MHSFVFTYASVSWILLSLLSLVLMGFTLNNGVWIVRNTAINITSSNDSKLFYPSLGIQINCTSTKEILKGSCIVHNLNEDPSRFPTLWKISYIFFVASVCLSVVTTIVALFSCYFLRIFNKSIFNITGCIQALTGLLFVNVFIFYVCGWGNQVVVRLCDKNDELFSLGNCHLGTAFYYALFGLFVTFTSAGVSTIADRSVFRYKITRKINAGKKLICMM